MSPSDEYDLRRLVLAEYHRTKARSESVSARGIGKESFDSYSMAHRVAERNNRRRDISVAPYHCEHCRKWHIGSITHGSKAIDRKPVFLDVNA